MNRMAHTEAQRHRGRTAERFSVACGSLRVLCVRLFSVLEVHTESVEME
jgi:hypothetical protein